MDCDIISKSLMDLFERLNKIHAVVENILKNEEEMVPDK